MFMHSRLVAFALCCSLASPALAADGLLGVELVERDGQVVITRVLAGSGAASIGIQPGDILMKVGTTSIQTIQDALDAKNAAANNTDIPMILQTPGGVWPINGRFEKGQVYMMAKAVGARPKAPGKGTGSPPRPGTPPRPGKANPPRP